MLPDPTIPWLFEAVGIGVWIGVAVYFAVRISRERAAPVTALVFFAATTMFWQEWYADWAAYLLYNPDFALIPWDATWWTTPNKPWAVVAGYGWFIGLSLPALAVACIRLSRRRGGGSQAPVRFGTALLVVIPAYWVVDVIVEFPAVQLNWWTYADPAPLAFTTAFGGFSFLYPILPFAFWAAVAVWLLAQRDDRGFMVHERVLRVSRMRSGASQQAARFGAMALMLNLSYLVVFVVPICLVRELFGDASAVVP